MSEPYKGKERREQVPQSWHLKKEINVSMIISIIGIAVSIVVGYTDLKRDISLIQADIAVLHQHDSRQSSDLEKSIDTLHAHYIRMDSKLDHLIERSVK